MRPALEFGLVEPFIDYVRWLATVLGARGIPTTDLDVSLNFLMEFFAERLPSEEAETVAAAVRSAITALHDPTEYIPRYERLMPEAHSACDEFGAALVRGDPRTSAAIFREVANQGETFLDAALHLVQPTMYRIGRAWQENRISIAQEHLATATVHGLLARVRIRDLRAAQWTQHRAGRGSG